MEMTLHRALIELKMLKKRIAGNIAAATFVITKIGRKEMVNGVPEQEIRKKIQSEYDCIVSLIADYEKIKYAVIRANSGAKGDMDVVKVCGRNYTVAELIEAGNSVYGTEKNDRGFKADLLNRMAAIFKMAKSKIDMAQSREADRIKEHLESIAGGNKLSTTETEEQTALWHKLNDVTLIDPLNIEKKIESLSDEIRKFRIEADSALSEQNAIRKIDVDLTSLT